jgi:hypothetical protein
LQILAPEVDDAATELAGTVRIPVEIGHRLRWVAAGKVNRIQGRLV